jgi:hypothetical protein
MAGHVARQERASSALPALREPVSAFAIHAAHNVEHMTKALAAITKAFGLEIGDATPLALLSQNGHARPETR